MKKLLVILAIIASVCLGGMTGYLVSNPLSEPAYLSYTNNEFSIHGQMTGYSTMSLRSKVLELKSKGITELRIFIMSPGGMVLDAFGACDVIRDAKASGIHVTTIGLGMVASASMPVFLAGDTRMAGANTVFMLHKPDREEITDENYIELMDLDERLYIDLVADNCDLTYDEVNKLCNDFTWFTAEQAKRYGMVDEII